MTEPDHIAPVDELLPSGPAADPHGARERRIAARHLLQQPLSCAEHDPDVFRLIRRHQVELDRWFTQRLGYRLHVDADTARLSKPTALPFRRPMRTAGGRAFSQREHVLLALVLASVASGPGVISLRDLVDKVRVAAVEAEVSFDDRAPERRSLVRVLQWMVAAGLAEELHDRVDAYAADGEADAVLKVRPDRIALLPQRALVGAKTAEELLARADRRGDGRPWMRARLVEDPVLYRDDLDEREWSELRRRLGAEARMLDEMFGLVLEVRAEGVAAIDPAGALAPTMQRFPTGGTLGHATLLLIDALRPTERSADEHQGRQPIASSAEVTQVLASLVDEHRARWANQYTDDIAHLQAHIRALLVDLRLAEEAGDRLRLLPAAWRFLAIETRSQADDGFQQGSLL